MRKEKIHNACLLKFSELSLESHGHIKLCISFSKKICVDFISCVGNYRCIVKSTIKAIHDNELICSATISYLF